MKTGFAEPGNVLETDRLVLRRFEPSDFDAIHRVLSNEQVMKFSLSGVHTREKSAQFIRHCIAGYAERGTGLCAVVLKAEQAVIGYCGFYFFNIDQRDETEVGFRLHPDYWGRGLASEAAAATVRHGFEQLGRRRLISIIEPENVASIRVAEKIGMAHEKDLLFRDKIPVRIYSIARPA